MQLFVRNVDGRTMAMRIEPNCTVAWVKRMCMPAECVPLWKDISVHHGGRVMADESFVSDYSDVCDFSTLTLGLRCYGGGGDGGATGAESRDCYLQMYADKKPDKIDPYEAILAKWTRCAISAEALKPPCVMDYLGNLYNKEVVVQALLTKSVPKKYKNVIKGLKDIIDIHLVSIPGIRAEEDSADAKFHCPVSGLEFNGRFRFFALKSCGHVLSEKALKEVRTETCLICYVPFSESDKIVINGTDEEVIALRERWEEEKAKLRGGKKEKKLHDGGIRFSAKEIAPVLLQDVHAKPESHDRVAASVSKRKPELTDHVSEGVVRPKGSDLIQQSKKFKAAEALLPLNATKKVFASIFTSSSANNARETYSCRSLPIGRN